MDTKIVKHILIAVIFSAGWFNPVAFASIGVQDNCSYQEKSKIINECNQAWINKYLYSSPLLYKQDEFPKAMMPMDLPGIFTNPPKPKLPLPEPQKIIIPEPRG